ncbi:mfeA [Symbiodinium sp. CCMP2456]|nr:mfeA [Symbiodinium sp. CCMP2456]
MASGGMGVSLGSSKLREAREAKAKTKTRPNPGTGPSNASGRAPRRESPLAAAARRAREAMAGTPASKNEGRSQRPRASSGQGGQGLAPKLRKPQLGAEPPPPTPCTPESPLRSETQPFAYAARSLIRSHGSPERDLDKHPSRRPPGSCSPESPDWKNGRRRPSHAFEDHDSNADFANSSVGSAPIDVSWEDPDMAAKSAERAEILEAGALALKVVRVHAAAVLRREAQDLGQALRAWVGVEAEPERSAPEELPSSLFAPLASEPEEIDELEPRKAERQ